MKAYASIENIQLAMKMTRTTKKSTLPVLHGVKITAHDDKLEFVGTDLDTYTKVTVPALIEEEGETLLDFQTVKKVVESAKKNDHVLFTEDSVKAGKAGANIRAMSLEDFPGIPHLDLANVEVRFPGSALFKKQLGNALRTTSDDMSRRILTTIGIDNDNDAARLVATDSYRLYVSSYVGRHYGEGKIEISKDVAEIIMNAEKHLDEITISRHGEWDLASVKLLGNVTCEIISRTIEGNYPNWKQLVADNYDYSCDIERKTLEDGAKFIKKMVKTSAPAMLDLANGKIRCREQDSGDYSYDIEAGKTNDPHDRYLSVFYLIEALATSKEKTITMKTLDSPYKPMVFENPEGDMMLVMPVRVA